MAVTLCRCPSMVSRNSTSYTSHPNPGVDRLADALQRHLGHLRLPGLPTDVGGAQLALARPLDVLVGDVRVVVEGEVDHLAVVGGEEVGDAVRAPVSEERQRQRVLGVCLVEELAVGAERVVPVPVAGVVGYLP